MNTRVHNTGVIVSLLLAVMMSSADAQDVHRVAPAALGAILAGPSATAPTGSPQGDVRTPGLIVGDQLVPGGLDYPQLERLVSQVRQHH